MFLVSWLNYKSQKFKVSDNSSAAASIAFSDYLPYGVN